MDDAPPGGPLLPVLIAVLIWAPAVIGLGSPFVARVDEDLRAPVAGFLGLAVLACLGMAVNFAAPLSSGWSLAALIVGWVVGLARRRMLLSGGFPVRLVWLVLVAIACAALTQLPGSHFDAGLYHLQAIRWLHEHRLPLGLANLHGRLGFNVSWFAVGALLEFPGLDGRSAFVLGALPVVLGAWAALAGLARIRAGRSTFGSAFLGVLAVPAWLGIGNLGSPGPDLVVAFVGCLVLALWGLVLEGPASESGGLAAGATLLSVFATTMKVSSVVLLLGSLILLAIARPRVTRAEAVAASAFAATLLSVWLLRGIATSGCLVYPVASTCLSSLPWSVPVADVRAMSETVTGWARAPGDVPAGLLAPVGRAIPYLRAGDRLPTLALVSLMLVIGVALAWRSMRRAPPAFWTVLAVSSGGIAFWLATAPDPRFGLAYLLPASLAPLALAMATRSPPGAPRGAQAALVLGCALFALWGGYGLRKLRWDDVAILRWPEFPTVATERRPTGTGLEVNVPEDGAQCWNAPLPCAPAARPHLTWTGTSFSTR